MESIGSRIKRIRMEHNLSQKELSEMIGTPAAQLSRWEHGKVEPGLDSIRRICQALAIHEHEITGAEPVFVHPDRVALSAECDDLSPDELLEVRILLRKWKQENRCQT